MKIAAMNVNQGHCVTGFAQVKRDKPLIPKWVVETCFGLLLMFMLFFLASHDDAVHNDIAWKIANGDIGKLVEPTCGIPRPLISPGVFVTVHGVDRSL
ncbi:MAG: hypothetical protein NUW37_15710 [Planctomycetes bacterium]|nr:hypothetical protein [Planctomycetota bacterium]